MLPCSSMSIFFAAGTFGSPGMVIMSPQMATMNPAPLEVLTSRTGNGWLVDKVIGNL